MTPGTPVILRNPSSPDEARTTFYIKSHPTPTTSRVSPINFYEDHTIVPNLVFDTKDLMKVG